MKRNPQKGAILPFLAISELKRRLQTAADAGALAGAHEIHRSNREGIKSAALYDAKQNGFEADAETDSVVTVNNPPTEGRYAGNPGYVEVITEERAPLFFMTAFVDDGYLVRARSVAGVRPDGHCLYVLDDSDNDAFQVSGGASIDFTNCGVQVNSTDDKAARASGGGLASAARWDVTGDTIGDGFTPQPHTGQPPLADPLADLAPPEFGEGCDHWKKYVDGEETLDPGVYCKGITFTSTAVATLNSGTYIIMGGGLKVGSGSTVIGDGVTFYITEGAKADHLFYEPITINGGSVFQVSAPTSGDLKGMLFFEDRTIDEKTVGTHTFNGTADVILEGTIYTPNADVKIAGNFEGSGEAQNIMFVVRTLAVTGTPQFAGMDSSTMARKVMRPVIVE
jgi:hypothetical protein